MRKSPLISSISLFVLICGPAIERTYSQASTEQVIVPKGTVLRLALSARTSIGHIGQPVEAKVTEPVFLYDRLIIPVDTKVLGKMAGLNPVPHDERILALIKADFTPLHDPVLQFDRLVLEGTEVKINTDAVERNTQVVTLHDSHSKDPSQLAEMKSMFRERLGGTTGGPSKMDAFKNFLFSQLPYHPQVLDRGSLFDAVLQEPAIISVAMEKSSNPSHLGEPLPRGILAHARLITALNSSETKEGTTVEAALTEPIYEPNHQLLYPEGTELVGSVIRVHPAGRFAKSGSIRFAFNSIRLPAGDQQHITGQIGALEAQRGAHVTIDAEGGTRAHVEDRLLAPIYSSFLAGLATPPSNSRIRRAIVSNGMGIIGRVAGAIGPTGFSTGLSYYGAGRSVYFHLLHKGREVKFPTNTGLEIFLGQQSGIGGRQN